MKCPYPDRVCRFRDRRGFCCFSIARDEDTCPDNCSWLMKEYVGEEEVNRVCMICCVYELPEECSKKEKLLKKATKGTILDWVRKHD